MTWCPHLQDWKWELQNSSSAVLRKYTNTDSEQHRIFVTSVVFRKIHYCSLFVYISSFGFFFTTKALSKARGFVFRHLFKKGTNVTRRLRIMRFRSLYCLYFKGNLNIFDTDWQHLKCIYSATRPCMNIHMTPVKLRIKTKV